MYLSPIGTPYESSVPLGAAGLPLGGLSKPLGVPGVPLSSLWIPLCVCGVGVPL